MKARFSLTFDIVTQSSAMHGDTAFSGYVTRYGGTPRKRNAIPRKPATFTLRDALEILERHRFEGVECDSCPWSAANPPRWINFSGSLDSKGESLSFALRPARRDGISAASMVRVARLFRAYGESKPLTV
jgi:hypothetical protein